MFQYVIEEQEENYNDKFVKVKKIDLKQYEVNINNLYKILNKRNSLKIEYEFK